MKKLILLFLLISTNSLAWRIDYNLALPGSPVTGVDVINYLIFSKDLLNEQNEKIYVSNNNGRVVTVFVKPSDSAN